MQFLEIEISFFYFIWRFPMNIQIIILSKKLTPACEGALKEYEKRLSRYCKFSYITVKKEKDGMKYIKPTSSLFYITTSKNTLSSEEFASIIENMGITRMTDLIFFVGFSTDILAQTLNSSLQDLSISSLTLSSSLTAAVLSEQIYRCYRIINQEPYHK